MPKLIFLDTNVVQYLLTFGEYIYGNYLSPEEEEKLKGLSRRTVQDVHALAAFIDLGRRNGWPLVVSQGTLDELAATCDAQKRHSLVRWGLDLADYFQTILPPDYEHTSFRQTQLRALEEWKGPIISLLPDEKDRLLIFDAVGFGCDVFLTMDYNTIWKFRERIRLLGISVVRPVELLEYMRPSIGLLL
ncbi:MAG: hypothetical protein Q8P22_04160 [Chloroflexota bacterium]|nr:hypothetical protein [Chloroflexota bacterium]